MGRQFKAGVGTRCISVTSVEDPAWYVRIMSLIVCSEMSGEPGLQTTCGSDGNWRGNEILLE
jgi:hypothetical protein